MEKVLLVLAHGSRIARSNSEVHDFSQQLGLKLGSQFDLVKSCFLELAEPKLTRVLTEVAALEPKCITVYLHF